MLTAKAVLGCVVFACALVSCDDAPVGQPGNSGIEPVAGEPTASIDAAPATAVADLSPLAKEGARLYLRCRSCHSIEPDGPNLVGPNLHGIIGAPIGRDAEYDYSPALAGADGNWTAERLDAWLEKPREVFPGNKMAFPGLPDPQQRAALIAFLEEAGQ